MAVSVDSVSGSNPSNIEVNTFRVSKGLGAITANCLRQFTVRGERSWKVAGYKLGDKADGFGLANQPYSVLEVLRFKLDAGNTPFGEPKVVEFHSDGKNFCANGFKVINTGAIAQELQSMEAVLVCASEARTAEQNNKLIRDMIGEGASDYIAIPSMHSVTYVFSYKIEENNDLDIVTVTASPGSYRRAVKCACNVFQGLL